MAKTREAKIESYDEQIAQLNNRKKQELQKLKKEQRAARTRRLCSRHGLLESMLPDTVTLTDEQFKTFLEKTVANDFGRRTLAGIATQNSDKPKSAKAEAAQQTAPALSGSDGGERKRADALFRSPKGESTHLYTASGVCALPGACRALWHGQAASPLVGVVRRLSPPYTALQIGIGLCPLPVCRGPLTAPPNPQGRPDRNG